MNSADRKPNKNAIVAKSNDLLPALARFRLQELRLVAYCLAHYDSRKTDNRTFEATVRDFKELFGMRTKDAFAVVLQAVTGVNSKPLIMDSPKTTEVWTWFSGFRYHKFEGRFEFRITPELQPYLLALQERFTRFRLKNVCAFRSAHTWRLYENLKQWEAIGSWFVGLDELKGRLGVAGKYEIWSKFKVWVIDPAVKEINAKSDLYVNWEAEKRGRRIHALLFFVNARPEKDVIDIGGSKENFTRALMRCGVRKRTALDYTRRLEAQNMLSEAAALLPDLERSWEKTGQGTLAAYVVGALRNRYFQGTLFPETEKSKPAQVGGVLNKTLDGLPSEL